MNLRGNVKAEAVVEPNGVVKSVEVKGGHPVLVRAAQDAIYKWKWAPATRETREPIEVRFDPRSNEGSVRPTQIKIQTQRSV